VSPLWRDEVGIFIGPRRVVLNRMSRGLRPTCVADYASLVEGGGFTDWEPTLAVLAAALSDRHWQDARARVVIANHWVRYAIVPWRSELAEESERVAYGRLLLQEVYGDDLADWTVTLGQTTAGRSQLACAIPAGLEEQLRAILAEARLQLLSLQPHLVVSFNRWRHRVSAPGGWLVVLDDGTLAAARLTEESWAEVHSVRIGGDWTVELGRLQTFGRLAGANQESSRVLVEAPHWLRRVAGQHDGSLEWLEPDPGQAGTLETLAQLAEMHA
jgi:hypothetical protein